MDITIHFINSTKVQAVWLGTSVSNGAKNEEYVYDPTVEGLLSYIADQMEDTGVVNFQTRQAKEHVLIPMEHVLMVSVVEV